MFTSERKANSWNKPRELARPVEYRLDAREEKRFKLATDSSKRKELVAEVRRGQGPCTHPGAIAISQLISAELKLEPGDPVLVVGARQTVAVVEAIEPLTGKSVYLGRVVTANARAQQHVGLRPLHGIPIAEQVVIVTGDGAENDPQQMKTSLSGLYLCEGDEIELPATGLMKCNGVVSRTAPDGVVQVGDDTRIVARKSFADTRSAADFACLGGMREAIDTIKDIELRLLNHSLLGRHGSGPVKATVFHGAHGIGKSRLAGSVVNESSVNSFLLRGTVLAGLDSGEIERRLKETFAEARNQAPSFIVVDDLDLVCPRRGQYSQPDEKRAVTTFLGLLDDISAEDKVTVIATASSLEALDPALRRAGRFDVEFEIGLPNVQERTEVLRIYTCSFPLAGDVDLERIAEAAHGFTGADLELLCKNTLWHAIKRQVPIERLRPLPHPGTRTHEPHHDFIIEQSDFLNCARKISPSLGREVIAEVPKVAWDDVGGYPDVKDELLKQVVTPWANRSLARGLGIQVPKGVLLCGPPGTGKTYIALALAARLNCKVIVVRSSSLLSKWLGEYEQNISRVFEVARKAAPVVVIMDEVDTIAARRGGGTGEGNRAMDSGLNCVLEYLDGVQEMLDVFLVCITNRPDMLDEAFTRSGRIGKHIYVGKPDQEARKEIFQVHLGRVKACLEGVDVTELANLSHGMVGADIKELVRDATTEAFFEYTASGAGSQFVLHRRHLMHALETVATKVRSKNG